MARPRGFHYPGDLTPLDPSASDGELNAMRIDRKSGRTTYQYGQIIICSERKAKGEHPAILVRVAHLQNFPAIRRSGYTDTLVCGESFPRYDPVQYTHVRIPSYAKIDWDTPCYGRVGCGLLGHHFRIFVIIPERHVVMCRISLKIMKHQQYLVNNLVLECRHLYDSTHCD